ncbi:hypothetical protein ACSAZK_13730 [Methanosarcina sp. Mfa9]|uniref:hypothetical protein n=1 Tax=Methanosarcina sp. Mfa9 TaxID=3439063 RepID=UPI003F849E65
MTDRKWTVLGRKIGDILEGRKLRALDLSAYSTVFDALFLLVLISLAGVLLMPSLQAGGQYEAAYYTAGSEMDSHLLETLLSCKFEDFDYEISPFSVLGLELPENSVVESPVRTLFGKEQKHRTFADLTAEYLALSLMLSDNGSSVSLNPLAADYNARVSDVVTAYLDRELAGRFSYRFEAYWYPVKAFPLGSELIIGDEAPANAIRQSAKLSMPPGTYAPSKEAILSPVSDTVLVSSLNVSEGEAAENLSVAFDSVLDAAALEGARAVSELLFPSEYFGSVFGEDADESMQTLLYGVPESSGVVSSLSPEEAFLVFFAELLETDFKFESGISPENVSASDLPVLQALLLAVLEEEIRTGLEAKFSGEINRTVSGMVGAEDFSEAQALRDAQVESVYRQVNPGGARIVLSLWGPS